jgi:hypothetical protein
MRCHSLLLDPMLYDSLALPPVARLRLSGGTFAFA